MSSKVDEFYEGIIEKVIEGVKKSHIMISPSCLDRMKERWKIKMAQIELTKKNQVPMYLGSRISPNPIIKFPSASTVIPIPNFNLHNLPHNANLSLNNPYSSILPLKKSSKYDGESSEVHFNLGGGGR